MQSLGQRQVGMLGHKLRVDQGDQSHRLARGLQLSSHFERHDSPQGETGDAIRSLWLKAAHHGNVAGSPIVDGGVRWLAAIAAARPQAINRLVRPQRVGQLFETPLGCRRCPASKTLGTASHWLVASPASAKSSSPDW